MVEDFVFPMEKAKNLRNQPRERYEFAIQYLPLPAAFREAAKGLRAIIRERKREDEPYEAPLSELYRLACVRNLTFSPDPSLDVTWFLMSASLPVELWEHEEFDYNEIGYEKLGLLGKRDRGRIEDVWGPPTKHRDVWGVASKEIRAGLAEHNLAVTKEVYRDLEERKRKARSEIESQSSGAGCLAVIGAAVGSLLRVFGFG